MGPGTRRNKVVTAQEAVGLIHDGDTVATNGFVGIGFAEEIAVALEQRFLTAARETGVGSPSGLTLVYAAGQGDGQTRGLNHLGHSGLVRRVSAWRRRLDQGYKAMIALHPECDFVGRLKAAIDFAGCNAIAESGSPISLLRQ